MSDVFLIIEDGPHAGMVPAREARVQNVIDGELYTATSGVTWGERNPATHVVSRCVAYRHTGRAAGVDAARSKFIARAREDVLAEWAILGISLPGGEDLPSADAIAAAAARLTDHRVRAYRVPSGVDVGVGEQVSLL